MNQVFISTAEITCHILWANVVMLQFKENPDAWLLVDKILQEATYPQTKCRIIRLGSSFGELH